jgi:DnaA family protein
VVGFLLTRFPRDLPSLRGALEVLDRYSLIKQRGLTLPLVREALAAAQQSAELPRQRGGR